MQPQTKAEKKRGEFLEQFNSFKRELVEHFSFSLFFLIYVVLPITISILLISLFLRVPLISLMFLSIIIFFISSMIPDYFRLLGLLLENQTISQYSHLKEGYILYMAAMTLIFLQFTNLFELTTILCFALFGFLLHDTKDKFEWFIDTDGKIPKRKKSGVIKRIKKRGAKKHLKHSIKKTKKIYSQIKEKTKQLKEQNL